MRLGLIVRGDARGLGIQTLEAYRHLRPARTLAVDMGELTPYPQRFDAFPDARVARYDGRGLVPAEAVDWLVEGSDVIFTAETPYDLSLYARARARGVRTVCQVNPEFYPYNAWPDTPRPDLIVAPSTWRLEEMHGVEHLPFPVARDRLPFRQRTEARNFLHVGGHPAAGDRAGSRLVAHAATQVQSRIRLVIRTLASFPALERVRGRLPRWVDYQLMTGEVADYWSLYDEADVLIAPRRYGGQSLPVNEALSSGMPVIALDRAPEREWGGVLTVPAHVQRSMRTQAGRLDLMATEASSLAGAVDRLASEPDLVAKLSAEADAYAATISWDVLLPRYLATFARVLG